MEGERKKRKGKGTDLILTIFNKATKETITMDAADDGEQFLLTMAKAKSETLFLAKSCSGKLIIDHLMNLAEENKEEFMVAFMIALSTGIIKKEMFKSMKVHKIEVPIGPNGMPDISGISGIPGMSGIPGLDDFDENDLPDIPGLGGFGDRSGKPPTFN